MKGNLKEMETKTVMLSDGKMWELSYYNLINNQELLDWYLNRPITKDIPVFYLFSVSKDIDAEHYIAILKKIRDNYESINSLMDVNYIPLCSSNMKINENQLDEIISVLEEIKTVASENTQLVDSIDHYTVKKIVTTFLAGNIEEMDVNKFVYYAEEYDIGYNVSFIPNIPREWLYDLRVFQLLDLNAVAYFNKNITLEDVKNLELNMIIYSANVNMSLKEFIANILPENQDILTEIFEAAKDATIDYYEEMIE